MNRIKFIAFVVTRWDTLYMYKYYIFHNFIALGQKIQKIHTFSVRTVRKICHSQCIRTEADKTRLADDDEDNAFVNATLARTCFIVLNRKKKSVAVCRGVLSVLMWRMRVILSRLGKTTQNVFPPITMSFPECKGVSL